MRPEEGTGLPPIADFAKVGARPPLSLGCLGTVPSLNARSLLPDSAKVMSAVHKDTIKKAVLEQWPPGAVSLTLPGIVSGAAVEQAVEAAAGHAHADAVVGAEIEHVVEDDEHVRYMCLNAPCGHDLTCNYFQLESTQLLV